MARPGRPKKKKEEKATTSKKSPGQILAITNQKGGVGKTSVSLKMSKTLSELGYKVLLIDCDSNLGNTAIRLGLPINNSFYSLLSASKTFDECIHKNGNG